jgi:hypothetical protein
MATKTTKTPTSTWAAVTKAETKIKAAMKDLKAKKPAAKAATVQAPAMKKTAAPVVTAAAKKASTKPAPKQAAKKAPAAKTAAPAPTPVTNGLPRMRAETLAIYEAAVKGKMPPVPNFAADTHAPYRAKLAVLVAAAKARDVKALKAVVINPTSTSPKAMLRFRDWSVMAIQARSKKA